ncbi:hypothetical protein [Methylobacterium sp. Leaf94]|uniref:hypothetical protein n=1 Tax=Methylobacterium sp. Leaf94 TaxID=1736250 RepID=UPI000A9EDB70|nr:hypothetical protein [Methylobacterium sp. Leaf94]
MSSPTEEPDPFDPFGIVAATDEWCGLLKAAEELRNVDGEMMETMLEAGAPGPASLRLGRQHEAPRHRGPAATPEPRPRSQAAATARGHAGP